MLRSVTRRKTRKTPRDLLTAEPLNLDRERCPPLHYRQSCRHTEPCLPPHKSSTRGGRHPETLPLQAMGCRQGERPRDLPASAGLPGGEEYLHRPTHCHASWASCQHLEATQHRIGHPVCSESHYSMQTCGGHSSFSVVEGARTGDTRQERNSLL